MQKLLQFPNPNPMGNNVPRLPRPLNNSHLMAQCAQTGRLTHGHFFAHRTHITHSVVRRLIPIVMIHVDAFNTFRRRPLRIDHRVDA